MAVCGDVCLFLLPLRLSAVLQIHFGLLSCAPFRAIWSLQKMWNIHLMNSEYIFLCVCEEALKYHTWKVRCCCFFVCVVYAASTVNKAENSAFVSQRVYCMCVLMRRAWVQKGESGWVRGRKCRAQRVWVGMLFSIERSPLFSRACLPRHRSYQATLYGLNGLAGMAAPHYPPLYSVLTPTMFVFYSFLLFLILPTLRPPKTSALLLFLLCFHSCSFPFMSSL